jgi:hypothetical protein
MKFWKPSRFIAETALDHNIPIASIFEIQSADACFRFALQISISFFVTKKLSGLRCAVR